MKRFMLIGTCLVFCSPVVASPPVLAGREKVASQWLTDLCVAPPGAFSLMSMSELSSVFDAWEHGNTPPATCSADAVDADAIPVDPPLDLSKTKLIPSFLDRFARMTEFQYEVQQTPSYVYGVLEGAPAGTASSFLPNSPHYLLSLGGPLHMDEIFLPISQRTSLCGALGEDKATTASKPKVDRSDPGSCNDIDYLAARRKRDHAARLLSAITFNWKLAQVPPFESGILSSVNSAGGIQRWSPSYSGTFDASKLYRSVDELQALATYIASHPGWKKQKLQDRLDLLGLCQVKEKRGDLLHDGDDVRRCIGLLATGSIKQRFLLWTVPVIAVKTTTPFDLAKYGNAFQQPPNKSGHTLYDVTVTWNLQRDFANATSRTAAIKIADTILHPPADKSTGASGVASNALDDWQRRVKALYVELKGTPEVAQDEHWWAEFRSVVLNRPQRRQAKDQFVVGQSPRSEAKNSID